MSHTIRQRQHWAEFTIYTVSSYYLFYHSLREWHLYSKWLVGLQEFSKPGESDSLFGCWITAVQKQTFNKNISTKAKWFWQEEPDEYHDDPTASLTDNIFDIPAVHHQLMN